MRGFFEAVQLDGRHVRLEPLTAEHAEQVLEAADDDAVFEHLSFFRPTTPEQADALIDRYLSNMQCVAWAQVDTGTGQLCGMTSYYDIDQVNRSVAIGSTWLSRRCWRTGINTESKLLLLRRAFDELGCARVVWHTDIANLRSQAAIERLGAIREGVLRKHRIRKDGTWRDTVSYSMLDEEWPAARDRLTAFLAVARDGRAQPASG